jgi:hypothetical protein
MQRGESRVPGTTVRIRKETREALRELEHRTGERPQDLLERAVNQFRRSLILAETNVAYGRLHGAEVDQDDELGAWEATLADGLGDD